MKKAVFSLVIVSLLFFFCKYGASSVQAKELSGVEIANTFTIDDKEATSSDIMVNNAGKIERAKTAYDATLFGVLSRVPLADFRPIDESQLPIIRNGTADVAVTNISGNIKPGDLVTSSEIAGKGQKAVSSGYVLGTALTGFDGNSGAEIQFNGKTYKTGIVTVAVRIEYADISSPRSFQRFFDYLGGSLFSSIRNPNQFGLLLRFLLAGLILLLALIIALITFSRSIPKAVEAIGRNPLARRSIYVTIGLTVLVTAGILAMGIIAAVVILKI